MKLHRSIRFFGTRLTLLPALFVLCFSAFCDQAHAGCGLVAGSKGPAVKLPIIAEFENEPFFANINIVGLWKTTYTNSADHSLFLESFKTWHVDFTESESAFLSPEGGNVCVGVWKFTDFRTVKLHHIGWLFDPTAPAATAKNYFTVDEVVTVAPNGKTYTGTFTFKKWNLDGTPFIPPSAPGQVEVKGTITATRITV